MVQLNEALANLQKTLEQFGLDEAMVVINCHKLTPCQSQLKAREIALSGFGTRMVQESKTYRYSCGPGGFSWVQLEDKGAKINLFYDVKHC